MKVFFTCGKYLPDDIKERIQKVIESEEGEMFIRSRHSGDSNTSILTAEQILRENQKQIKSSDIVIAELSLNSMTVGFHVSSAIEARKPILFLFNFKELGHLPRASSSIPATIKALASSHYIIKEYSTSNLEKVVSKSLQEAKKMLDVKFNLIISAEINAFLEWCARERGDTKSEVTRVALEKYMREMSEYQDYLNENKRT
jgi:predicted DNA-binding protein